MLKIELKTSSFQSHIKWLIDINLAPGVAHHFKAPNGSGKSTFFEELKAQWSSIGKNLLLGFVDQPRLEPFQDLDVQSVMDILWDVTPGRHEAAHWRELPWWKDSEVLPWFNRKISQLSGGENQWLKILMMRSVKSDVWILDEPFQSLDVSRQSELKKIIREWLGQGKYLLVAHHDVLDGPTKTWSIQKTPAGFGWMGV